MNDPALLILAALAGLLLGVLVTWWRLHARETGLRQEKEELAAALAAERRAAEERTSANEAAREQLGQAFSAMASEALKHNSSEFLKLAQENLQRYQSQAQQELAQKEKAVENLVKPIREALTKTEAEVRRMENERREAFGALNRHIQTIAESHRLLQTETRNLVQALRRPEVRGQWGEMTLKRLTELAGMVEHCDFVEQVHSEGESGRLRPDMVVRMPDSREIIVDAKTPLDAYLSAVEATDDAVRERHLDSHARNVRQRVRELSAKAYWQQFSKSPDFVVLFIPGDQFLSAALDRDHALLEDAMANKVVLATPTSLVALLRAVGYGWRQAVLAENAEHIRQVGEEVYGRLGTFAEHLGRLGKSLEGSVSAYNKAVGSFDSRVLPGLRKFTEMGISAKKEAGPLDQIERAPRQVEGRDEAADTPPDLPHEQS
ncbi:DNA recombination protein RmuC [Thiohalobacter thiocyanaticus]|uniref:DNA recombination protein RmuC n=1 Tax=Thiohalobacter thiocyanaticus TaxID=585455 RepID=A0A426QMG0_9GAMM|nr:DNA recombination protein RmuC [Thiohalobacter thiocyanaticus]RRQ22940.1 DNA recombination protein RmuC [Thiohalobacter thiocyanaticus]